MQGPLEGQSPWALLNLDYARHCYCLTGYIRCAGSVLTIAGKAIQALQYKPTGATVDISYGTFPTLPVPVSYPQTASFTMLTLEPPYYTPEVSSKELIPAARSRWVPLLQALRSQAFRLECSSLQ